MKVAIIGSRNIQEFDFDTILRNLPEKTDTIVSGGAKGVDEIAGRFAKSRNLNLLTIEPDYETYGKKAPLIRNREIVALADFVLAIWDFKSRGTADVIAHCIDSGVPVKILCADESADI